MGWVFLSDSTYKILELVKMKRKTKEEIIEILNEVKGEVKRKYRNGSFFL